MASFDRAPPGRRTYRSGKRAEQARQTRARILAAATERFIAVGYAATTMQSVATAAEVSVPTVELIFRTKARLLKEAIDVAIAGDDAPVPMLERDWASAAGRAPEAGTFLATFARALRNAAVRSAGLIVAAQEAAPGDPEIGALTRRLSEQRAITVTWVVDGLRARARLRPGLTRRMAVDTMWLLMDPTVFMRLHRDRGWTPAQFERWFIDSCTVLLLAPGSDQSPRA